MKTPKTQMQSIFDFITIPREVDILHSLKICKNPKNVSKMDIFTYHSDTL